MLQSNIETCMQDSNLTEMHGGGRIAFNLHAVDTDFQIIN